MLELASRYGNGPTYLKDIAQSQDISEKYLWHLIAPLKAAGLIRSSRGAHGGYSLAKNPAQINLSQVLRVLEGSLGIVECVENNSICNRNHFCVTRDIWKEISDKLEGVLSSVTLAQMLERQKDKGKELLAYNI